MAQIGVRSGIAHNEVMSRQAWLDWASLLDALYDGVVLTDAQGVVTSATAAAERHFGVAGGDLAGRPFATLPSADDEAALLAALRRVQDRATGRCEIQLRLATGGAMRVLDIRGVNRLDDHEHALVFVTRDVTEHAAADRALRESERRYRRMVEEAGDIIFQCDTEGRFTFVNRTASAVMGYLPAELLGRHFTELVRPDHRERLVELYLSQRDQRRPDTYVEFPAVTKDGREVQVVIEDEVVTGVQAVARDMTERRQYEEHLEEARRLEAIGTLAGGVAHDFNNLLQAIRGNAELMALRFRPGGDADLQAILDASDRAASLVRQLLAFGQRQPLQPVALHVGDAIAAVCRDWVSIFRRIDLEVQCDADVLPVRFDPTQFEQVLVNLLLNARDAMPRGGRVRIEAGNAPMTPGLRDKLHVALPDGPFVCISVIDTGAGMSEQTLRHIFEPFFTTKEQGKGSGLGLSSAYGIVAQGGGHIAVESRPGAGATFRVYLPAA
jgi:two-component system cell cycle sensor histidine kinase/response regulator CckA